jgi:DNA-binding transcriptional MerR regulator
MTQWYVKDLSKLTKVSVRTLHHYDKIGLLKPSIRLENKYRVYSEKDLLKLQQILALKFFGFELTRIKTLMEEEINMFDHFRTQQRFLEQKVQSLQEANLTLEAILSNSNNDKSVPWKTIMKLIEDYQMTQEIEHKWVKNVLNPTELKEYANFERGLKTRFTPDEEENFNLRWLALVKDVESNLNNDPGSELGIDIGRRCMDWVNATFDKQHAALKKTIWEKGFKGGHTDLNPVVVAWLDKACDAYYRKRIYSILARVGTEPSDAVLTEWEDLMEEMYGDEQAPKDALMYGAALKDESISQVAKDWLIKLKA